ncbi:MAG: pantetheine-phosphate adenylyltransferase [Pseudobdellovibrionaceae bacterium]
MSKRIGIYPGTFDPITKGHLHIIRRASRVVDHLIVSVAPNSKKGPLFSQEERLELARQDIANMPVKHCEITVEGFDELLMHYAIRKKANCIIRGLRAISDFEYEFQMTGMNAKLNPDIETVFLMASDEWQFVSSSFIKEIYALGGDVSSFVTPNVLDALSQKALSEDT